MCLPEVRDRHRLVIVFRAREQDGLIEKIEYAATVSSPGSRVSYREEACGWVALVAGFSTVAPWPETSYVLTDTGPDRLDAIEGQ